MKRTIKHTIIATLLLVIVAMLNIQFYFEKNSSSSNTHHQTLLKAASEKITISPFTDLIEEDEDESESKTLLHFTLLCSLVVFITFHGISTPKKNLHRNTTYILTNNSPLYVRYCTFLI